LLLVAHSLALAPVSARASDASDLAAKVRTELDAWDIEAAETAVKELQKAAPNDKETQYLSGRVAFEQGRYDEAVKAYEAALGDDTSKSEDYRVALGAATETAGMVVEESTHFAVRYRPGKDAALVPYALESLEAAFAAVTKDLGYAPPRKVRIEFYGTPRALARVSSLPESAVKTTGTVALCKYDRLLVTSPRALVRGYEWQDTLTHEFTHLIVTRKTRDAVPIWLHEGIAKYLETRWRGPAGLALDGGQEAMLLKAAKNGKLVSFERMSPSIALLPSQEEASLSYSEVFTFVQFIDKRLGMAGLRGILEAMKGGKSDRDAVSAAFGMPFDRVEATWRAELLKRPMPKMAPGFEKLVFKDDAAKKDPKKDREKAYDRGELGTLPTPAAREHAHLAELFRVRSRLGAATLEFAKAHDAGGAGHPALSRKYALVLMSLNQNAKAEGLLKESLAQYPDDETNHLLYGKLLATSGRAAEAKGHLLLANQRDPFDEEIHKGLVAVAAALKDESLGAREQAVVKILQGSKRTWLAADPGNVASQAFLRIEQPFGAKVFIDGVDTGLTTPVAEHPVPSGRHVVRLEPSGAPPIEKTLELAADELVPFPAP
jgi:tetratricopeptide (TPR) repeat protein